MAAGALVRVRIDGVLKEEAAAVLADAGLTISDAMRLLLTRVAQDGVLPFEPFRPDAETVVATEETR